MASSWFKNEAFFDSEKIDLVMVVDILLIVSILLAALVSRR